MVVWPPRCCVSNTGGIFLTVVHECLCMANILVEINLAAWKRSANLATKLNSSPNFLAILYVSTVSMPEMCTGILILTQSTYQAEVEASVDLLHQRLLFIIYKGHL